MEEETTSKTWFFGGRMDGGKQAAQHAFKKHIWQLKIVY